MCAVRASGVGYGDKCILFPGHFCVCTTTSECGQLISRPVARAAGHWSAPQSAVAQKVAVVSDRQMRFEQQGPGVALVAVQMI